MWRLVEFPFACSFEASRHHGNSRNDLEDTLWKMNSKRRQGLFMEWSLMDIFWVHRQQLSFSFDSNS